MSLPTNCNRYVRAWVVIDGDGLFAALKRVPSRIFSSLGISQDSRLFGEHLLELIK